MKKGGEEEEEEVWLSQKTRTTVLAVNDCSWWIITRVLSLYHQLHSGSIQRKTLKHDELLCRIRFLILCVVFLVPWMNTLPGENMLPLLCKSMGPYVGLPEKVKLNHLAKTLKSISRKSYIWACLKIGNTPNSSVMWSFSVEWPFGGYVPSSATLIFPRTSFYGEPPYLEHLRQMIFGHATQILRKRMYPKHVKFRNVGNLCCQ